MFQFWGNFGAHFGARDLTLLKMFGQHFWATFSGRKFPPKNSAQKLHHLRAANPFGGQGKEGKGKGKWRERGGRGRERERARGKRRGKRKGTGSESSVDSLPIYGHFGPCLRSEAVLFCKSKLYHQLTLDPSAVNTSSDTSSKVNIFWALLVLGPADWSWLKSGAEKNGPKTSGAFGWGCLSTAAGFYIHPWVLPGRARVFLAGRLSACVNFVLKRYSYTPLFVSEFNFSSLK